MYSKNLKNEALEFRKKGYSIKQIAKHFGIARSTSSVWSRGIEMDQVAKARIDKRSQEARGCGALERKRRLLIMYRTVERIVSEEIRTLSLDQNMKRLLCSFLYWGEGAKTGPTIKFTNSDPKLIITFLALFRIVLE